MKVSVFFRAVILTTVFAIPAAAQSWQSPLFPYVNGKFSNQEVEFAGRTWKLDDFSYVGYYRGERTLANVSCNVVTFSGSGDITSLVQKAVNQVGAAGGGIVRIPSGTFSISSSIAIPYSNVSIEGAGSAQTFINVPSSYQPVEIRYEGLFTFGKSLGGYNQGWIYAGPVIGAVVNAVQRGDQYVDVATTGSARVGDWVVLQQYFWPALAVANSRATDAWPGNSSDWHFSFSYLRQITSISGTRVFLDAPIPWTLDPANSPVSLRFTDGKMKENVGLKGLTIQFANNVNATTGRPEGAAAYFEGVRNGWVYDVKVTNIPRFGFYSQISARLSFTKDSVSGAQDLSGDGYGYGFHVYGSQNVLIKNSQASNTRHNFTSQRALTSMLVYSGSTSSNSTMPDDTHHSFEQAILWDMHTQKSGSALSGLDRGDSSVGAYETLASGVVWNFYGDGKTGKLSHGGQIDLKPSPDGSAIVIGVTGQLKVYDDTQGNPWVQGQLIGSNARLQVGTSIGALGNVLYDGIYQGGLQPASLYQTQLFNRIGTPPPDWASHCGLN